MEHESEKTIILFRELAKVLFLAKSIESMVRTVFDSPKRYFLIA